MNKFTTAAAIDAWMDEHAQTLRKGQDGWQDLWKVLERFAENERLRQAWESPGVADMRRCANDEDDILCILGLALQGEPLTPYLQSKVDGAKANGEAWAEYRAALDEVR